jgi:Plasmid pRiA4b ORF-3-like protein.
MLGRVLDHLPRTRLGEPVAQGVSPHMLALVASRWCDEQRFDDVIALLEPLFIDLGKLDERAADAANILMNCYLARQQYDARNALVERLKKSHNRVLRSAGLQREATVCSDRGDVRNAWRAFNEARHLTPDDPSLSHLEVLLLRAEGRDIEARERADYWMAVLAADPRHDNRALIEALHALVAEAAADDPLDDLPQDYPERRLVLHIALEGIDPPIWRRVEVENTLSFEALHHVIQAAMGWEDAHLHEFKVGDYRIGMGDSYDDPFDDGSCPARTSNSGRSSAAAAASSTSMTSATAGATASPSKSACRAPAAQARRPARRRTRLPAGRLRRRARLLQHSRGQALAAQRRESGNPRLAGAVQA